MHLVGMDTLLILLSLGPGYHHPRGQDITTECYTQQSDQYTPFLFCFAIPSKQTKDIT
jgi:hypothetical protein